MDIIIAGGTGFIGRSMVQHYIAHQCHITVIGRSLEKIKTIFGDSVSAMDWHQLDTHGTEPIKKADLIINLVGATIGEKRWTKKRKKEIMDSRVVSTTTLASLCAKLGKQSPPLFNASAVGIYGFQKTSEKHLPPGLDENEPIDFDHAPDFLSTVGRAWEKATQSAKDAGVRVVNMRFGVVLAKKGGALQPLSQPFKFFLGGPIGNGQQPFPWIVIDDLLRAIDFVFAKEGLSGPINFVSPGCVSQRELARALGRAMHRPSIMPMPGMLLKLMFGQMADELLLHGQHVVPHTLQQLGFEFHYPDIDTALRKCLGK